MSCWTIQSLSNLKMKLHCDGSAGNGNECEIDASLWRDKCIPESAVPSFEACNMARRYEVEILLGLQCGEEQPSGVSIPLLSSFEKVVRLWVADVCASRRVAVFRSCRFACRLRLGAGWRLGRG